MALPSLSSLSRPGTSAPPVSQFDFYDADQPVAAAADFVAAHFRTHLR